MYMEKSSGVSRRLCAGSDEFRDLALLIFFELWTPSTNSPLFACVFKPSTRTLSEHRTLKLCERSHHLHQHATAR